MRMNGRRVFLWGLASLAVLALAAGGVWAVRRRGSRTAVSAAGEAVTGTNRVPVAAVPGTNRAAPASAVAVPAGTNRSAASAADALPEKLKPAAEALQKALDDDDAGEIVKQARILLASGSPAARREAADALEFAEWQGFTELSALLMDEDEEVAASARGAWERRVSMMEDAAAKKKMLESAAELSADGDAEFFESVIMDASVEMTDNEMASFLLPLYGRTENEESRKVILETLDGITCPEKDSVTIEEAQKQVEIWRKENAEEIAEEEAEAAGED